MVSEVRIARRGDVDCDAEGKQRKSEEVERWRSGLVAEGGLGVTAFSFDTRESGRHRRAGGVGVWEEIGNVNCEFGTEEE